jgi:DNA mismatch repair ATPase MutL
VRAAIGAAKAAATPFGEKQTERAGESTTKPLPPGHSAISEPSLPVTREELRSAFRLQAPRPPQPRPEQQKMDLGFAPERSVRSPSEDALTAPLIQSEMSAAREGHINRTGETKEQESIAELEESATEASAALRFGNRIGCLGARGAEAANSQLKPAQNLSLHADEISLLGQFNNSFIIGVDRIGLLLIDQHVAHERILFEQHWRALTSKRVEVQRLLLPETIDLTPAQAAAFDQLLPELEANGFELGRLSGRTIAIKAMPSMLPAGASQALLAELLDAIEHERRGLTIDELRAEIAASLACRAAIKIHTPLAPEKMRWLTDQLLRANNPATCPHGRPIILRITAREIERAFQRS